MIKQADEGTTSICAWRFWTTNLTVTFIPLKARVALATSSPIFLADCREAGTSGEQGRKKQKHDTYQTEGTDFRGQGLGTSRFTTDTTEGN
jgi:hypothetical protein